MNTKTVALLWAAIIIAAAFLSAANGLSDSASFGIIAGLSGAAYGSIIGKSGACKRLRSR